MQNWLSIAVGAYLIIMAAAGYHKGLIRMAVSAAAVIIALVSVNLAVPYVTAYLRNNTQVYETVENALAQAVDMDGEADGESPSAQREVIEGLEIPKLFKDALVEHNNHEMYSLLGADAFTGYVTGYLASQMIHTAVYILLFIVIFGALEIAARCLDLVARLPVISGVNKMAGAVLGGAEGLFFVWLAFLFVTAFSAAPWGGELTRMIGESSWLSFLYDHNLLADAALSLIRGLF